MRCYLISFVCVDWFTVRCLTFCFVGVCLCVCVCVRACVRARVCVRCIRAACRAGAHGGQAAVLRGGGGAGEQPAVLLRARGLAQRRGCCRGGHLHAAPPGHPRHFPGIHHPLCCCSHRGGGHQAREWSDQGEALGDKLCKLCR
jgi:hypothetical protein